MDTLPFTVTIRDTCDLATLQIDTTILTSLSMTYDIGEGSRDVSILDSIVIATPAPAPGVTCPAIEFTFDDRNGGPIDGSVFSYDAATQLFTALTSDRVKAGNYPMKV